jgi:hypothetical protein
MITIDKGVPVPPKRPGTETKFPFATMQAGDSFAQPPKDGQDTIKLRQRLTGAAHAWAKRHAPGAKFTTRVEPDGKSVRIWLLSKPASLAPLSVAQLPVAKTHKLANKEDESPGRKPPVALDMPSFTEGTGKARKVEGKRY